MPETSMAPPPKAKAGPPQWMQPGVSNVLNCPSGLEYLTLLDQILIKQDVHILEAVVSWEVSNKYKVTNNMGQQCYNALEDSNVCCRQCCGKRRSFKMHLTDNVGQEAFVVERPFKCCAGYVACCRLCADEITVTSREGKTVGYVREAFSFCVPHYKVFDSNDNPKLEIWGPCCTFSCCRGDVTFRVKDYGTGKEIGQIKKMWSGIGKEFFTDADNFGVSFPLDLDVKLKATLIGCVFLVDFMHFEDHQKGKK